MWEVERGCPKMLGPNLTAGSPTRATPRLTGENPNDFIGAIAGKLTGQIQPQFMNPIFSFTKTQV